VSGTPSDFNTNANDPATSRTIAFGTGDVGASLNSAPGTPPPATLEALNTLPGYKIEQKLGQGGMGAVFRATQTALNRRVAIKVLPENLCNNPKYVARLNREAMVLAKINHANVVGCIDMGEHKGLRYVVMEFIEGESLGGLIEKRKQLPVSEALYYLKQAVLGLDHAHALGIIHRDIKPDNMLLAKHAQLGTTVKMQAGHQLKIADLGLASFTGESTENTRLTHEGAAIGSPHYMSPEQTLGVSDIDFRTDIYALGVTTYHMLTGVTPYAAPSVAAVLARKLSEPMRDPRDLRPELPAIISLLIQKMTAREKADRYENYGLLLEDIEAAEQGRPLKASILQPPRASVVLREDTISSLKRAGQRSSQQRTRSGDSAGEKSGSSMGLIAAGLVIGVCVAGGAYFALRGKPDAPPDSTKTTTVTPPPVEQPKTTPPPEPPKTTSKSVAFTGLQLIEERSTKGWTPSDTGAFGVSDDGALYLQKFEKEWATAERTLPTNEFTVRGFLQTPRGADDCELRVGHGAQYVAFGIRFPKDKDRVSAYVERRKSSTNELVESLGTKDGLSPDEWRDLRISIWEGLASCFLDGKLFATAEVDPAGTQSKKVVLAARNGFGTFRALEASSRPEDKGK